MNYIETIKKNYSSLIVTYGSMIFEGSIVILLVALMAPLAQDLNVSLGMVSLLVTFQSLGTVSSVYFSGFMADKIGERRMLLFGLLFYSIFLIGMFFTSSFSLALVFATFAGLGHGFMDSPAISMLVDIFGDKSGPAMSVVAIFFSGGGMISSILVNKVLSLNLNYNILFLIYFGAAVLLAVVVYTSKYPVKQEVVFKESADESIQTVKRKRLMSAALLGVITFLFASGTTSLRTWISTYGQVVQGLSVENSVNLLTYLQIGNILGAFFFAYVLTKIHSTKVMIINGVVAVTALSIFLNLESGGVILIMVSGAVLSISYSLALNIIGELFKDNSGQGTGFIGTAMMSAGMIITFVTGRLLPYLGVAKLLWLGTGLVFLGTVLAVIFRMSFVKIQKQIV